MSSSNLEEDSLAQSLLPRLNAVTDPQQDPTSDSELRTEHAVRDVYETVDSNYNIDTHDEDAVWLREQLSLNKNIHWTKRPLLFMICLTVFFWAFATISGEAARQMITYKLACNRIAANDPGGKCDPAETQVLMSNLHLAYSTLAGIITLIALGKVGPLLDRYGRRQFILLILGFLLASKFVKFIVLSNSVILHVKWMVSAEILGNLCGGIITMITLTNCYISDISEPQQRIYYLGISVASVFVGFSLGPLAGNAISSYYSGSKSLFSLGDIHLFSRIFLYEFRTLQFEICIMTTLFLVALFVLPESRLVRSRQKCRPISAALSVRLDIMNDIPPLRVGSALNFLQPLVILGLPQNIITPASRPFRAQYRATIIALVFVDCLISMSAISLGEIFILYGIHSFHWNQSDIGNLLAILCASKAIVSVVISPVLNFRLLQGRFKFTVFRNQFDTVDSAMCSIGLVCEIIGISAMYFVPSTRWFLGMFLFTSFGSLIGPATASSIIKFFPESHVGEVFGAVALVKNLFTLAGPILFITAYKYSLTNWDMPGIVFLIVSFLLMCGLVGILYVSRLLRLGSGAQPVTFVAATVS